jgi:hypothetical protein
MTDHAKVWQSLHNRHKNETCVVIGNGPSLADTPRELFSGRVTLGSNRIYLLPDFAPGYYMSDFAPHYYTCVNPLVIEQSIEQIQSIKASVKFIAAPYAHLFDGALPLVSGITPCFSRQPWRYIHEGHTVTYVMLQLAFFLGFETVLLVGVDHRYTYQGEPNQEVEADGPDSNHFSPDYFPAGMRWHNPDLERSERAYRMARTVFSANGRRVVNLTPGSALDVFERGEVGQWI